MDQTITVVEAKQHFSDLMARVAYTGQRVVVERHGKPMIAWISYEDLKRFEQLERQSENQRERREAALMQAQASRKRIEAERHGTKLPDSLQVLDTLHMERTDELTDLR